MFASTTDADVESGFTLIEVLVALVILGLAFAVSVAAIGPALTRLRADTAERSATMYAESLCARIGADIPLADGQLRGHDGELNWAVTIEPWTAPGQEGGETRPNPLRAHAVAVSVSWPGSTRRQTFTIRTVQLEVAP